MDTTSRPEVQSDEEFLDLAFDLCLRHWVEGLESPLESLAATRPHLREQLEHAQRMARQVSVRTPPRRPRIGGYTILAELGRGGMASVFLARQESLGRTVALKVLPHVACGSDRARTRFLNEARAVARISHENVVKVFDVLEDPEACAYAMELIDGPSLAEEIERARADARSAGARARFASVCKWGIEIARALEELHCQNLLHRDVKPSNILLRGNGHAVLGDFGLVRDESVDSLTQTGRFLGTLAYSAPEQIRAVGSEIGPRTDIYSLGVTLYEALTLQHPFPGRTENEVRRRIESGECAPLRSSQGRIPKDLAIVVRTAMALLPHDRYATAADFAADLERVLAFEPIRARAPGLLRRGRSFALRHARWLGGAAAGAVLALALVIAYFGNAAARDRKREEAAREWREARLCLLDPYHEDATISSYLYGFDRDRRAEVRRLNEALTHFEKASALGLADPLAQAEAAITRAASAILSREAGSGAALAPELGLEPVRRLAPRAAAAIESATLPPTEELSGTERRLLGLFCYLAVRPKECHDLWEGLEPSDQDPFLIGALGTLSLVLEQPGRAAWRLDRACQAFPEAGFLRVHLADALVQNGDLAAAVAMLDRAEATGRLDSSNTHVRVRADWLAAVGREDEAIAKYEWLRWKHKAPLARHHHALLRERRGELERAVQLRAELVHFAPTHEGYRAALARVANRHYLAQSIAGRLDLLRAEAGCSRVPLVSPLQAAWLPEPSRANHHALVLAVLQLDPELWNATPKRLQDAALLSALGLDSCMAPEATLARRCVLLGALLAGDAWELLRRASLRSRPWRPRGALAGAALQVTCKAESIFVSRNQCELTVSPDQPHGNWGSGYVGAGPGDFEHELLWSFRRSIQRVSGMELMTATELAPPFEEHAHLTGFSISYTEDPNPSLASRFQPLEVTAVRGASAEIAGNAIRIHNPGRGRYRMEFAPVEATAIRLVVPPHAGRSVVGHFAIVRVAFESM